MIIINRLDRNRVFDKDINKYINDISNHIYQRLMLLNIETEFNDDGITSDDFCINIYNDKDVEKSNCQDCRNDAASFEKEGYSYSLNMNDDGNLKEIKYSIDDINNISNNWINLAEDIVKEIKYNLGYDNYKRQTNKTYQVKKGDSLYRIAKKFNTTVQQLKLLNNLKTDDLQVGQILIISDAFEPLKFPVFGIEYIVEEDDDLYSIANRFNTTVNRLRQINGLESNMLHPGQKLIIEPIENKKEGIITYIVRFGDTLENIALKYNADPEEIKELNNLKDNNLEIGQVLVIPLKEDVNEDQYIKYKVESGDSLYRIAKKFNTTVDELKKLNNLSSNLLKIGQELIVGKKNNDNSDGSLDIDYDTYIVLPEDNLYSIANKKNTTVKQIRDLNNLSSNELQVGQRLKIPR